MPSDRTIDWLLISALRTLYAARLERNQAYAGWILSLRPKIFFCCAALMIAAYGMREVWIMEDVLLLFCAIAILPQIFVWWLAEQVGRMNAIPEGEELGCIAFAITQSIEESRAAYAPYTASFVALLTAIVSNAESDLLLRCADDLDGYGDHAKALTDLVRGAC